MSTTQMILLGAIAGFTIYLGLPLGRVRVASRRIKAFLNAASAGILVFLLVEILAHATEPIEEVLKEAAGAQAAWGQFAALGLVYAIGFAAGLLSLLYLGRLWTRSAPREPVPVHAARRSCSTVRASGIRSGGCPRAPWPR